MKKKLERILNVMLTVLVVFLVARFFFLNPKHKDGLMAPDFSIPVSSGDSIQLSDLRGQYVLLDFWGSWCGPCRAQNPGLVQLYSAFRDARFSDAKGFTIVSVGIERREESWQKAIAHDGLNWPYHRLDRSASLRIFTGPLTIAYRVRQIPTTFLIDPQGRIAGVNLPLREIDRLLAGKRI